MFTQTFRNQTSPRPYRYVAGKFYYRTTSWDREMRNETVAVAQERKMNAKFPGTCRSCGQRFDVGTEILWSKANGAKHVVCPPTPKSADPVLAQMDADDRAMAEMEMAADRAQTARESEAAADADVADEADALLAEYEAARRAANLASLKPGIYRVEFSGRRNTEPMNLRISEDKRQAGAFRFRKLESYESAGRIAANGTVTLWRNTELSREEQERAQEALEILLGTSDRLGKYGEAYARESGSCFRCGRLLTDEDSLDRGLGRTCLAKVAAGY